MRALLILIVTAALTIAVALAPAVGTSGPTSVMGPGYNPPPPVIPVS